MICSLFSVFLQKFSTKCSALALLDAWMLAIYALVPRLLPTHCSLIRVHSRHNWKTTHAERWTQVAGPNHKITNRQCCYARSPPLLFEETTNKVNWSLCSQWLTGNMATSSKQQNVESFSYVFFLLFLYFESKVVVMTRGGLSMVTHSTSHTYIDGCSTKRA